MESQRTFRVYKNGFSVIEVVLAVGLFLTVIVFVIDSQWSVGDLFRNNVRMLSAIREAEYDMWNIVQPISFSRPFSKCMYLRETKKNWFTGWRTHGELRVSRLQADLLRANQFGRDCARQASVSPEERISVASGSVVEAGAPISSIDIFEGATFFSIDSTLGSVPDEHADIGFINSNQESEFFDAGAAINAIDVAEQFIYTANKSTTTQFSVLRAQEGLPDQLQSLVLVATSSLPGVAGARPEAVSIFYSKPYVVVGTKRTAGHEFHMFDVGDPEHPVWLGSREMNHNINDMFTVDSLVFLATSGNIRDLIVLDISDPSHITQLAAIDLPGNEDGRSIQISGNYIFLGRHKATVPGHDELVMLRYELDVVTREIVIEVIDSVGTAGDVTGISIHDGRVLATTKNPLRELQIFGFDAANSFVPISDIDLPENSLDIDAESDSYSVTSGGNIILY